MKEATGEVSMTVITLAAIAIIAGILAVMWPTIKTKITGLWASDTDAAAQCKAAGGTYNTKTNTCNFK